MVLVDSGIKKGGYFFEYIRRRIKQDKNFMAVLLGQTGSGKSFCAVRSMELLMENPKVENICFSAEEFMNRLNSEELKKGDVLIWDECGISLSAKEWQSVGNKLINYILQSFRHLNLIVFFTTPNFSFIDASSRKLFHCTMETMGIDYKTNECEVKPLLIQVNPRTGDTYYKYLRIQDEFYGVIPITRLYFGLPSKKLRTAYEIKKKKFTSKLNKEIYEELKNINLKRTKTKELTLYQRKIMDYLSQGLNTVEIASKMGVTKQAISHNVGLIRKKGVMVDLNKNKPQNPLKVGEKGGVPVNHGE